MDTERTIKAYVVECSDDYYFIGITDSLVDAWFHHINGLESMWTRLHKPLKIVRVLDEAESYDEFCLLKFYMAKYGINKVRGGNYKEEILTDIQIAELENSIKLDKDMEMNNLISTIELGFVL